MRLFLNILLSVQVLVCASFGPEAFAEDKSTSDKFVRLLSPSVRGMDTELETLRGQLETLPNPELANRSNSLGFHSKRFTSANEPFWVEVDLQKEQAIDMVAILPVLVDASEYVGDGYGFPREFKIEVFSESRTRTTLLAEESGKDFPKSDIYPYLVHCKEGVSGRYVRITSLKHWRSIMAWTFAVSELMVIQGVRNVAANCPIRFSKGSAFTSTSWGIANLTDFQSPLGPPSTPEESPNNGFLCEHSSRQDSVKWVQIDLGKEIRIDEIRLLPSRPPAVGDLEGLGFPIQFRLELDSSPEFNRPIVIYDTGNKDFPNPGDNPVVFDAEGRTARYVRCTGFKLHHFREGFYSFSLGELQVYSGSENVALGKAVSASDVIPLSTAPNWKPEGLVNGYNGRHKLIELPDWLEGLELRRQLESRIERLVTQRAEKTDRVILLSIFSTAGGSGLLVLSLATLFVYNRIERKRSFEKLRRQIARDLHDDIGSNLGGIALISESGTYESGISERVREDFKEIHAIASSSNEAMRDIVWLIRDATGSLEELLIRLRDTANRSFPDLSYTFQVSPDQYPRLILSLKARRHLYFAFKETLHNIYKHAEATQVSISIDIDVSRRTLTFEVGDNGRGFNPDAPTLGHGLGNLKLRSEKLNGSCKIKSEPGRGTTIVFTAFLKS